MGTFLLYAGCIVLGIEMFVLAVLVVGIAATAVIEGATALGLIKSPF